jgi:hypothetical protein
VYPNKDKPKVFTARKILSATVEDIASSLNPFGPNDDPAKSVIKNPNNPRQYYNIGTHPLLSPIDDITMDECIKYPNPEDRFAKKYKPSDCIKIMKEIKNGICNGHRNKSTCINLAANKNRIKDPNEYGEANMDILLQMEGQEREERKTKQNKSSREKSPKSQLHKTFKRMFAKNKAGRRTRNHRRKFHK